MKSWSSSYSYTSNGKNSSETVHKSYNNGKTIYEDGYTKTYNNQNKKQNNELKEKFYKRKIDQISKNKDWELLEVNNDFPKNKYIERPSSRHRLTESTINRSNKIAKIKKQTNNKEVEPEKQLSNLMHEMNLSMFNNNDFFKF